MGFHVKAVKPLTILHGQENGLLDDSLLVTIQDVNTARGLDMTFNKVAGQAWNAMSLAAREAGFDLYPTDLGYGTYRTFARQVSGFKNHYTQGFIAGRKHKEFPPGTVWSLNLDAEDAGTPGTSNHGTGNAIDVAFLDNSPRPSDKRSQWVLDNYESFGFSHEFTDKGDPRHIRYFAGDTLPERVLGVPPIVDPPHPGGRFPVQIKEDEMLPVITNLEPTRGADAQVIKFVLMDDGRLRLLGEDEWIVRGSPEGFGWTNAQIAAVPVIT
jgi:hypothetical protein